MQVRDQQGYMLDICIITVVDDLVAPPHRHGALQLFVPLDGGICSAGPTLADVRPGPAHLIAANAPHAVHGHGGLQAVVLLPQQSSLARRLTSEYLADEPIVVLPEYLLEGLPLQDFRRAYEERWSVAAILPSCRALLAKLSAGVPEAPTVFHPAIRRALRVIDRLERKRISAADLSAEVGLSKSHFLRTFSQNMGMPLRPYLQWRRMMDAFRFLIDGANVTDAAVESGFSDAAHLNRVSHRMFAMNPSILANLTETFQIHRDPRI